nr:GLUG motif-containing protein [Parabacteroides goldsteinii]
MKNSFHLLSFRLLIAILLLCSFSKRMQADDTTQNTWENYATEPLGWNTSPYPTTISISSAEELAWVAKMVNEDTQTGDSGKKGFEGVTITLTKDIDLSNYNWIPIGEKGKDYRFTRPFKGNFDGGNDHHSISNIKIVSDCSAGLFGQIDHATIKNIKLTNCCIEKSCSVTAMNMNLYAGCIAGASFSSTIENCYAQGAISYTGEAAVYVGGITGKNASTDDTQAIIKDCDFEGKFDYQLTLTDLGSSKSGWVGGIAGTNNASNQTDGCITNCHAKITAEVIQAAVGGITTSNRGVIEGCSTEGSINVTLDGTTSVVGGIVSENVKPLNSNLKYTIKKCTSSCDITFIYKLKSNNCNVSVGGIAGINSIGNAQNVPPITDCTTSGTISVKLEEDQPSGNDLSNNLCTAGGIVGYSKAAILNCKSSAKVSATTDLPNTKAYAGGIAGIFIRVNPGVPTIINCVASGTVTTNGVDSYCGGIAGQCSSIIKNCISTATITSGGNTNLVGGIAGYNTHTIQDCYSTGDITSTGNTNNVGGIVGENENGILNCYATGKVTADYIDGTNKLKSTDPRGHVGGIAGISTQSIENCLALNTGGITYNDGTTPGRIVGYQDQTTLTNNSAHKDIPTGWENNQTDNNGSDWDGSTFPFKSSDAWDFSNPAQLPSLKKIDESDNYTQEKIEGQPTIPITSLQDYTITFDTPEHGQLNVTAPSVNPIQSGNKVQGGTVLTITATPENNYKLDKLTVNGTPFNSGNTLTVSENIIISAIFSKIPDPQPEPDPEPTPVPPVYHLVTLPQIEGATTDPVAGEYEVEAWSSFRFYLTLDKEYDQSSPIVTTDRGETITPRASDGAYIIKYVRQPIAISIDGIVRNPDPVANETIGTNETKVRTEDAYLHIHTSHPETVFIYTFSGTLLHKYDNLSGDKFLWLPQGNYIVVAGNKSFKIQIQK